MTDLATRFNEDMRLVYQRAKSECGYNATRYLQMLAEKGGLETARTLVRSPHISDGFETLWRYGRLDLTVEYLVIRPEYASLFSESDIKLARDRMTQTGFKADSRS